jgi:hypothetical protein
MDRPPGRHEVDPIVEQRLSAFLQPFDDRLSCTLKLVLISTGNPVASRDCQRAFAVERKGMPRHAIIHKQRAPDQFGKSANWFSMLWLQSHTSC